MPLIICFRAECSSEISETMPGDLSSYEVERIPSLHLLKFQLKDFYEA